MAVDTQSIEESFMLLQQEHKPVIRLHENVGPLISLIFLPLFQNTSIGQVIFMKIAF